MKIRKAESVQENSEIPTAKIIALDDVEGKSLTDAETEQMHSCERVLQEGLGTFFEVGSALLTIREERLYRATHHTFQEYCRERWGIGQSYASRVIGAAERISLLPPDGAVVRPLNEFQIRPFLKLEVNDFPRAWKEALSRARDGKVTPRVVASVIGELWPVRSKRSRNGKKRRREVKAKPPLGKVLTFIQKAKRHIERGELSEATATLEDMESFLFAATE